MKTLRFLTVSLYQKMMLIITFTFLSQIVVAQTISGYVYDECSGDPIAGATIRISVNLPGSPGGGWSFLTDSNGQWDFSFFGDDPNGPYIITVAGGASSPSSRTYYRSYGSGSGYNFDLLPLSFNVNINGEEIDWQNNPSSPHIVCKGEQNCIDLVQISDGIPIANGPYCYKVSLYSTNSGGAQGTLLVESNCNSFGRLDIGNPCEHGSFDLSALLDFIDNPPPVIRMEVQQFCCESGCEVSEGTLVNTEVVYIRVRDLNLADADFKLIDGSVSSGVSNRSSTRPGPSIGEASCGIFVQNYTSGNEIDGYQIVLEEVNCQGSEDPVLIDDSGVLPAPNGDLPGTYTFNGPTNGFFLTEDTEDRCFKVTLTIFNPCGGISVSSFFSIDQNCPFCLVANPGSSNNILTNSASLLGAQQLAVFPNPIGAFGQINFSFKVESKNNVGFDLFDNTGKKVRTLIDNVSYDKGVFSLTKDISDIPDGLYLYRFTIGEEIITGKIVK